MSPNLRLLAIVVVSALLGAVFGGLLVLRLRPLTAINPTVITQVPPQAQQTPTGEPSAIYTAVDVANLPGWSDDTVAQALPGLKRACQQFQRLADGSMVGAGAIARPVAAWRTACQALNDIPESDAGLRAALEKAFVPYRVTASRPGADDTDKGTFTGYYEAELNGSLVQTGNYQVPIYAPPRNLITANLRNFLAKPTPLPAGVPDMLVGRLDPETADEKTVGPRQLKPFYSREEIDHDHALAGSADVLVWADDPVAAHILHIQGSGRVTLPDGQVMHIGFAAHNGRPFRGLGSILLEAGAVQPGKASMIAIRDWLKAHPDQAADYMNRNARYIFFRRVSEAEASDGPIGALGTSLSAGRSLAVDPRFIPLGAPVWLDVPDPDDLKLQRLVVAADVGTAITGPVRGDYFWGHGEEAFLKAARMKSAGSYFVFIPQPLPGT